MRCSPSGGLGGGHAPVGLTLSHRRFPLLPPLTALLLGRKHPILFPAHYSVILTCLSCLSVQCGQPENSNDLLLYALSSVGPTHWQWKKESEVAQSCPTLCDPMDCSLPGSAVHGIFQASVLEWVAISFSRGSSWPRDRTQVSCTAGRGFTREAVLTVPGGYWMNESPFGQGWDQIGGEASVSPWLPLQREGTSPEEKME